jgi:hypothetical protein
MADRIVLHVGTHRTGTTSLQGFLRAHDDLLATVDTGYPPGFLLPVVHTELPLLTVRAERTWPARLRFPETRRASWVAAAQEHVRAQVTADGPSTLVYIHEDLSYLRYDDELERLRGLFAGCEVQVVVVLRERESFLRSYRSQLLGTGFELSDDPDSFAYLGEDSWLLDHDALVGGYQRWFGKTNVAVLDYDATMERDGSVIPVFAELLGIDRASLPSLEAFHYNGSGAAIRLPDDELLAIRRDLDERFA